MDHTRGTPATNEAPAALASLLEVFEQAKADVSVTTPGIVVEAPVSVVDIYCLPNELLTIVLAMAPFSKLGDGTCAAVCRRWAQIIQTPKFQTFIRRNRWQAYERGEILPKCFDTGGYRCSTWAVGSDGTMVGDRDKHLRYWRGVNKLADRDLDVLPGWCSQGRLSCWSVAIGTLGEVYDAWQGIVVERCPDSGEILQTLPFSHMATALAVKDGILYGTYRAHRDTVWSWSCKDQIPLREFAFPDEPSNTIVEASAIEVGANQKLYVGALVGVVHVWSTVTGDFLYKLPTHFSSDQKIVCGLNGTVYSRPEPSTHVRVWSGVDGRELDPLIKPEQGNWILDISSTTDGFICVAERRFHNGHCQIRVFSGSEESHELLGTVPCQDRSHQGLRRVNIEKFPTGCNRHLWVKDEYTAVYRL
eukprot:m.429335 g.429335  ORF g.429335 m.429335 type:complete len:418 (-) comp16991_c0_seq1:1728-2981(-)